MCGNGIRCVGKYVYDKGYTDKKRLTIETLAGIRTLELEVVGGKVRRVTVDMGIAVVSDDVVLDIAGGPITCTPVSVGNPHAVCFVADAEQVPLTALGPLVEHHTAFPGGVNAEFVQVLSDTELRMRVWERGSGVTLACGTGACASAAAAVKKRFCRAGQPLSVQVDGGNLTICVAPNGALTMTGPAETIYEGETAV